MTWRTKNLTIVKAIVGSQERKLALCQKAINLLNVPSLKPRTKLIVKKKGNYVWSHTDGILLFQDYFNLPVTEEKLFRTEYTFLFPVVIVCNQTAPAVVFFFQFYVLLVSRMTFPCQADHAHQVKVKQT